MEIYAALDVSLEKTSVCILDRDGRTVLEAVVASEPEALAACLAPYRRQLVRLGLEAGPLSEWLVRGLAGHGLAAVLMETRQVRAALSAMTAKTDRSDARGMAHLLRLGWFRPVHVKTVEAREQRALLSARSVLTRRLRDIENSTRGPLRGFGLRLPRLLGSRWDGAVREMVAGHPALPAILEPLLLARAALRDQLAVLDKRVRDVARADEVCRRLMTVPGVGAVVALTFKAAVDRARALRVLQVSRRLLRPDPETLPVGRGRPGRRDQPRRGRLGPGRIVRGGARHVGPDGTVVQPQGVGGAAGPAPGAKRAKVALARKLGVVMHRMWVDGTDFRFGAEPGSAAVA